MVSNRTGAILQDKKGFIWIGTQTGLQRYDGTRFVTYLADVHNADALQSDWISTLFEDSRQRLWVGTSVSGACLLNRKTGKFYNFNLHLLPGAKKIDGIWRFLEDSKGNIWLSAYEGYYKFDETKQKFEPVNDLLHITENVLSTSMAMDKNKDLWFATTDGLKKLNHATNVLTDKHNNPEHLAIFDIKERTSDIVFDTAGNAWVSTGYDRLLYRYNIADNKIWRYNFNRRGYNHSDITTQKEFLGNLFITSNNQLMLPLLSRGIAVYDYKADSFLIEETQPNLPQGLHLDPNTFSACILTEDKEKNIWIASDAGLNIFNFNKPFFTTYGPQRNTTTGILPPYEVSDFLQENNGDIFMSYYFENGGIARFDKDLYFKQQYLLKNNINPDKNQFWTLFKDEKGIIWSPNQAGTILQLNAKTNGIHELKDSLLSGSINQIVQDKENNIWIAHWKKGLLKIDGLTKKITGYTHYSNPVLTPLRKVMCILPDEDKIWVGTILNGLLLFDKKAGVFTETFVMDEKNRQSISNNNITGILSFNKDTLIIATQGGISIFNKKTKIFTSISSKDGLPNNLTQAIKLDDQNNLWAAFAGGLSKINLHTLSITNYDENDGITDNQFNKKFVRLADGRLIIGASKSFMVFNPSAATATIVPPDVTITGFKVFDKIIQTDSFIQSSKPILLDYENNSFRIEFASLQFRYSSKIKYWYQLEGIDKKWMQANEDRSVSYNQLPPGNYIFKIKCANRDGIFCKQISSIGINIMPPFYKRWWFILSAVVFGSVIIYSVIKWREKEIKLLEAGKTKLQKLTAEKYKTQFEAEQISSFFTTSLFNKNDVEDVLWDVAKNLISKLGFVDCMIYLWNDDKTRLVQKAGYGPKGSLEELTKKHFDVLPGQGVVGAVAATGEAVIIPDTTVDKRYRVDDITRLSEICVPIKYNEQLLGVIDSEHHEKNFFTRQHLQVLTTIATLVASKIKSIESEQCLRHQKAELADINQQLAEVQLAALRSQMNPHFIFNALNSIKKFVIANEPSNAEKYLGKFSKLIRLILDNSQTAMVTVEKELQLLKLYLDLEQLRFGTKLSYAITVDENIHTNDLKIPSMIVQPFVENAMLHGIMHREDGGQVSIHFLEHTDWLEITIEDNGVGRSKSMEYKSVDAEPHHSVAIEIATKRLQALKLNYDTPAGISIIDLLNNEGESCGTKVIIAIPVA